MREIVQEDEPILREEAESVPIEDIKSKEIQGCIRHMEDSLAREKDGVALAAPQIGVSKRIFVVAKEVYSSALAATEGASTLGTLGHTIYINPKIKKRSREKDWLDEGCLSVRWLYGKTKRSTRVTVEAYDENGKKFTRGASGLLAQIFQHEVDHLNGILFIDHAKDLHRVDPDTLQPITK